MWRWDNTEAFGSSSPNENPSGQGAFKYNLRFPGQYYDSETGTHYNYFRDYDPSIGRYIESDPLGLRAGVNTYAYAKGEPVFRADPFGLASLPSPSGIPNDIGAEALGKLLGGICAGQCKRMRNPRQTPDDAATEICNELTLDHALHQMQLGIVLLKCRETCVQEAKKHCDKNPLSCNR